MSSLVGGSLAQNIIGPDDVRLQPNWYQQDVELRPLSAWFGFSTPHWPKSGGFVGDGAVDVAVMQAVRGFDDPEISSGTNSRYGFAGVTRGVYNSPVGGVTVKLFRTSGDYEDVKMDEVISDPQGNYFVSSPYYPDAHYCVMYKIGTPDIFGTTENTLIGA